MPSWTNTGQKERKPREEPRLQTDSILTISPNMVISPAVVPDKSFNAVTFPFASWVMYWMHRNRLQQGSSLDSTDLEATTTEQLSLRQGLIQGGEWKRAAHSSPCVSNCDLLPECTSLDYERCCNSGVNHPWGRGEEEQWGLCRIKSKEISSLWKWPCLLCTYQFHSSCTAVGTQRCPQLCVPAHRRGGPTSLTTMCLGLDQEQIMVQEWEEPGLLIFSTKYFCYVCLFFWWLLWPEECFWLTHLSHV